MNAGNPPRLDAASLFQEQNRRDQVRVETYNTILSQVQHKIRATARIPNNAKHLVYTVPEFIPGVPRFDMRECIIYLAYNLRSSGFTVNYTHPNLLFISWKEHERNYRLNESPVTRTLIHVTEQSIKKQAAATQVESTEKPVQKKSILRKTTDYGKSIAGMLQDTGDSQDKNTKTVNFI